MNGVLNGKAVVGMLKDFGLSGYEARAYFVLLTVSEVKVGDLAKKSYVPQSKAYEVLDKLTEKGFAQQVGNERPKKYRATALERVFSRIISRQERFLKRLNSNFESLQKVVGIIGSLYEKFGAFRLFSPILQRREEAWIRVME
jgi:sugar-specific transcriptional regulator TrmB